MYGDLGATIAAGDLAGALDQALVAWRETRSAALADVIDRLTTRIGGLVPPFKHRHAEWMARAQVYDPVVVGPLIATGAHRLTFPVSKDDLLARYYHPL